MKRRYATRNPIACWLCYCFWESHSDRPRKIYSVSSFVSYQTQAGEQITVEHYRFWRTLWRALGMVFPACKRGWDRIERRVWEPHRHQDDFQPGM